MSFVPLQPGSFLPANSITDRNIANGAISASKIGDIPASQLVYTSHSANIVGTWSLAGVRKVINQTTGVVTSANIASSYTITTSDSGASYQLLPATGNDSATSGYKLAMPVNDIDTASQIITQKYVASGKVSVAGSTPADVQSSMEIVPTAWNISSLPTSAVYRRVNTEALTVGSVASYMVETGTMTKA